MRAHGRRPFLTNLNNSRFASISLAVITILTILLCCNFSCPAGSIQAGARDTIAGLNGEIIAAQAKYQPTCGTNPAQPVCQDINKAVAAENDLVTAVEAYCGWSTTNPPAPNTVPCVPVSTAQQALQTAIANANTFITQLKAAL